MRRDRTNIYIYMYMYDYCCLQTQNVRTRQRANRAPKTESVNNYCFLQTQNVQDSTVVSRDVTLRVTSGTLTWTSMLAMERLLKMKMTLSWSVSGGTSSSSSVLTGDQRVDVRRRRDRLLINPTTHTHGNGTALHEDIENSTYLLEPTILYEALNDAKV